METTLNPQTLPTTKLTTGAYYLKRGDTSDPEDWRMSHRLSVARGILTSQGFLPTVAHSKRCQDEKYVAFGYRTGCDSNCTTKWSEEFAGEPSDEIFNAAFALAEAIQDARRAKAQAAINESRRSL